MKLLSALVLALGISFSAGAQQTKEWEQVATYLNATYYVHVPSINHKDGYMYFTLKGTFDPPLMIRSIDKFETWMVSNVKSKCDTKESQTMMDSHFSGDDEIVEQRNKMASTDTMSPPQDGAAHKIILDKFCKTGI